jgi:NAD(P)-dependent dehydrogenase (short-subunit alcohol dehydrogenase family)
MWTNLLKDRVAFITGAASGMGRASAVQFAAHGAKVLVADVNVDAGAQTVEKNLAAGGEAVFVSTDVSSDASVASAVKSAVDRWGTIDILFNNAASTQLCNNHDRGVHELPEKVWDKMLDVTLKSVYLCSRHCLVHMFKKERGSIINVTSCDAILPEAGFDSYTAAKGGVISLTKAMAVNYGKRGVRVNCISPGYVITEAHSQWYPHNTQMVQAAHQMHLTRRLGEPNDVANMAVYLASDLAGFITGAIIPVDGGYQIYKPSPAQDMCRETSPEAKA